MKSDFHLFRVENARMPKTDCKKDMCLWKIYMQVLKSVYEELSSER